MMKKMSCVQNTTTLRKKFVLVSINDDKDDDYVMIVL